MKEPKGCHAAKRLRQRYGIKLTREQCSELATVILSPEAQQEHVFLRRVADTYPRRTDGSSRWWINFEFLIERKLWALAVVEERKRKIITFLPPHAL